MIYWITVWQYFTCIDIISFLQLFSNVSSVLTTTYIAVFNFFSDEKAFEARDVKVKKGNIKDDYEIREELGK